MDELSLKTFSDADVEIIFPRKIGPAKTLVLLIDSLKARHLAKTVHVPLSDAVQGTETSEAISSGSREIGRSASSQELVWLLV